MPRAIDLEQPCAVKVSRRQINLAGRAALQREVGDTSRTRSVTVRGIVCA